MMGADSFIAKTDKDHDLLIEVSVTTKEILRRLDLTDQRFAAIEARIDTEMASLTKRVAALEGFKYYLIGGAALGGFAIGLGISIFNLISN